MPVIFRNCFFELGKGLTGEVVLSIPREAVVIADGGAGGGSSVDRISGTSGIIPTWIVEEGVAD